VARVLTRAVGLDRRVAFEQGTALAMPFADARLDIAYRISASINITARRLCDEHGVEDGLSR
jgi:hypothetical protein